MQVEVVYTSIKVIYQKSYEEIDNFLVVHEHILLEVDNLVRYALAVL